MNDLFFSLQNQRTQIVAKLTKYDLQKKIRWLKMFIAFRFFKGSMYIKAVLERIAAQKKFFLL